MRNCLDAVFLTINDIGSKLPDYGRDWFIRPVGDSKKQVGNVRSATEILETAGKVISLEASDMTLRFLAL